MLHAYHRDSSLRTLPATVEACTATGDGNFHVVLDDTVLFPEGGGQPCDKGTINGAPVLDVQHEGEKVVHTLSAFLQPGSEVSVEVDWARRRHNMQHHSGQHLITAVADRDFGYKTVSWNLGEHESFLDLDSKAVKDAEMAAVERTCNELIRSQTPMTPTVVERDSPLLQATRGNPDAVIGPIRVVSIQGVDSNLCCGTHVSNLSDLQLVKLTHWEKVKKVIRVYFVAGDRAIAYLGEMCARERAATRALSVPPEAHADAIAKLKKSEKLLTKERKGLLSELAVSAAERMCEQEAGSVVLHHRDDANLDYLGVFCRALKEKCPAKTVFASCGAKDDGMFILQGPTAATFKDDVGQLLEAKVGGKGDRLQGKASRLSKRGLLEALLKERIASSTDAPSTENDGQDGESASTGQSSVQVAAASAAAADSGKADAVPAQGSIGLRVDQSALGRREAEKLQGDLRFFVAHHRDNATSEYLDAFSMEVGRTGKTVFASNGAGDEGMFILQAPDHIVSAVRPALQTLLQAKIVMTSGRLQGQASCLSRRDEVGGIVQAASRPVLSQSEQGKAAATEYKDDWKFLVVHHRDDATPEYLDAFCRELGYSGKTVFASCGVGEHGTFMLEGPAAHLEAVKEELGQLLQGAAILRGNRLQGQAARLSGRREVEALLLEAATASRK